MATAPQDSNYFDQFDAATGNYFDRFDEKKKHAGLKRRFPEEYDPASAEYQAKYGPGEKTRDPITQQVGSRAQAAIGGLNTGAALLAGLPVDTAENAINLGLTGYGAVKNLFTGRADSPPVWRGSLGGSESILRGARSIGIGTDNPAPEDATSRILHRGGIIGGSSIGPGGARAAIPAIIGGNIAAETLGEEWTGLGAMAPAAAKSGYAMARERAAARAAAGAKVFTDVGAQPSAGLATGSSFYNGLENLLSKFPGGARVMEAFRARLQADIGKRANTGVSAEKAGSTIESGIRREGGFLDRTKAQWNALDAAVAAKMAAVPGGAKSPASNTMTALDDLTSPVAGAAASTGGLANPKLVSLKRDIAADLAANPGGLPYEALRKIRTRIGGMLDDALTTDVPRGELKALYRALSKDMEVAATAAGAGKEFSRQNWYYSARQKRIENVLDRVIGSGRQPEDIFRSIDPKDRHASGKITAVLRSLEPAERKIVADAVVNKLGTERPSGQTAAGDVFSSDVFLTNWNKISPKAKAMLFPDAAHRAGLDKIAKAAETLRFSESAFEQTSGAVGSFAAAGIYAAPFFSLIKLDPSLAIAAATTTGAAWGGAKLLTNPRFVAWLANAPQSPPTAVANHFARLAAIYNGSDDEKFREELSEYIARVPVNEEKQ